MRERLGRYRHDWNDHPVLLMAHGNILFPSLITLLRPPGLTSSGIAPGAGSRMRTPRGARVPPAVFLTAARDENYQRESGATKTTRPCTYYKLSHKRMLE